MFTAAECRANAEKKLALAEHDNRHRRRLINAAEAWLFLAYRLSGEDAGPPTRSVVRTDFNYYADTQPQRITLPAGGEPEQALRQMRFACASLLCGREGVPRRVEDAPQEHNRFRIVGTVSRRRGGVEHDRGVDGAALHRRHRRRVEPVRPLSHSSRGQLKIIHPRFCGCLSGTGHSR